MSYQHIGLTIHVLSTHHVDYIIIIMSIKFCAHVHHWPNRIMLVKYVNYYNAIAVFISIQNDMYSSSQKK